MGSHIMRFVKKTYAIHVNLVMVYYYPLPRLLLVKKEKRKQQELWLMHLSS